VIPADKIAIIPPHEETENMEVHKHPHHVTHKKKWSEYFLEFLMLFLAVFLGFLAENYREHRVEKERGKQYVESFYQDLKTDTSRISFYTSFDDTKLVSLTNLGPCFDNISQNSKETAYLLDIIRLSTGHSKKQNVRLTNCSTQEVSGCCQKKMRTAL
jgi:hypothetical protein